jgi:hypothetical protein
MPITVVMPIELLMLALSVGLLFVLVLIQASAGTSAWPDDMANSRDNLGPMSVWQARTKRCVDNHREGLIPGAAVPSRRSLTCTADDGLGRAVYSRVAHAVVPPACR